MTPEFFHYTSSQNIHMTMSLYRATENKKSQTIVYFHGGGLLFGHRDDLPDIYINQLLAAGYDLLTCDYPLAPEASLDIILDSIFELLVYYDSHRSDVFHLDRNQLILFGRSAGAYLALKLTQALQEQTDIKPVATISLYGYPGFEIDEFQMPSQYYLQFPTVPDHAVDKLTFDHYLTRAPMEQRFVLYLKARQEGNWLSYLQLSKPIESYTITDDAFKTFPPTILAAATHDPDVPYRLSKQMSKIIPTAKCITVYNEQHDFDRDTTDQTGAKVYAQIINWLKETLSNI